MDNSHPIYVASPMLPELSDLTSVLEGIWQSGYVTNHGPLHNQLEQELSNLLNVPTVRLFNNGTIALLTALKMFDFPKGSEVITTPFTFAATAHAISWNELVPVFVDVDPVSMTLDPKSVERAVTDKTVAVLPVHVYGNVCDIEGIDKVAKKYGLKVIYDAAHAFAVEIDGVPISKFGDATIFSFHATKLFTTIEGGAIATNFEGDAQTIYMLRNFGIKNENEVVSIGINGKLNEIQSAIGLLNLKQFPAEKKSRALLRAEYDKIFSQIDGVTVQSFSSNVKKSEQYYPLLIDETISPFSRDDLYEALKRKAIFCRKYFSPICTEFEPYRHFPVISEASVPTVYTIKDQVLCLPFHSKVEPGHLHMIKSVVDDFLR
ncbi:DegT/DnrJ/EryC1/StrS family aminotransferase [Marinobacter persicus]|uniref:dTDP-4-amino-4,6-dideoxygalactose transaminase n=1 Tax=Marinobacter persicus TaxID=930118 RepID=A0A2S6G2V4_9GAMM|nr:DegT/DnrJ/EryC1/StrS family aminotransferase [Marinobacter persicus]PPK49984.1 dTDP-4-amino-4,6-dideoxygalactose transaminase [Marinobacter persicus]PPK51899.1 dTDP-4-amino-4,6-dideoxygalactose transaminase [Marinobacter persicus]PPK56566.1 dTDP-4-amino-4,6-dideoxygalactose transaminase [Marinobacter persicus]